MVHMFLAYLKKEKLNEGLTLYPERPELALVTTIYCADKEGGCAC